MTPARSASVVGHTSGQCVKPKKRTTALPRKSSRWRTRPLVSSSSSDFPYSAPEISVLLNFGAAASQATRARLKIMIDQKRGKEAGKVSNRVAEGLLRQGVRVLAIDAQSVTYEQAAERERCEEVRHAAHVDHIRQQAHPEEDQPVEQHLEARVVPAMRHRQHRHAGARVVIGAV